MLRQQTSWTEQTFPKSGPPLPDPAGDALLEFACARVREWETQVTTEAVEYRDQPLGPALVRYALDIRRQCSAVRLVLARYGEMRDADSATLLTIRPLVHDLSTAWRNHPDWRDDWV